MNGPSLVIDYLEVSKKFPSARDEGSRGGGEGLRWGGGGKDTDDKEDTTVPHGVGRGCGWRSSARQQLEDDGPRTEHVHVGSG